MHFSERDDSSLYSELQDDLLHLVPWGMMASGSSFNSGVSTGDAAGAVVGIGMGAATGVGSVVPYVSLPLSFDVGTGVEVADSSFFCSGTAIGSVECFPVVQPGILRKSSKSITRFEQHCHPFNPDISQGV